MTKKKSKIAEFFSNVGTALAFIWMLPVFVVKGVQEHFEKKREAKQPKREPIKFVCSECGETFESDNVEKEMRNHASFNGDYTYSKQSLYFIGFQLSAVSLVTLLKANC